MAPPQGEATVGWFCAKGGMMRCRAIPPHAVFALVAAFVSVGDASAEAPGRDIGALPVAHGVPPVVWPDFRGPEGQGHAAGAVLPLHWSESKNVRWKTPVHGRGWSTPVAAGRRLWMTTAANDGQKLYALCMDADTGRVLLDKVIFEVAEPEAINAMNTYASPSAVVDADHVYVHFGTYGTACLDTSEGNIIWSRRDLTLDHGQGPGSSPVLWGDLLIFACDGRDVQYMIALDKRTGETVWKAPREIDYTGINPIRRKAFSTPIVIHVNGRPQLVCPGAQAAMAYDPANGKVLWQVRYSGYSNTSRPVANAERIFINTGFDAPQILAVRLGGVGDITGTHVAWRWKRAVPKLSSMTLVDDLLFMVSDGGVISCLDAMEGKPHWQKRLKGEFVASTLYASGRIYFCDFKGTTTVVATDAQFQPLAQNKLDEGCGASPIVVDDAIILRTTSHLYRIEETGEKDE